TQLRLLQGLGDGPHDRVLARAGAVIHQLLVDVILPLPPDDRVGLRVGGHAVLAVADAADLHLGPDVDLGVRGYGGGRTDEPSGERCGNGTYGHGFPLVDTPGVSLPVSAPEGDGARARKPR